MREGANFLSEMCKARQSSRLEYWFWSGGRGHAGVQL